MADLQQILAALLAGGGPSQEISLRLVRKHGRPFLLLPPGSKEAVATLALYPAQTFPARVARQGLRTVLGAGLSLGTERISVPLAPQSPFVRFLGQFRSEGTADVPSFGVLAGNPSAPGQRFIFLVFAADGTPRVIVKAGLTDEARRLIRHEKNFLANAPGVRGIPRVQGTFESAGAEAIAMDFVVGDSPREQDERQIPELLGSWVRDDSPTPLTQTRVWSELQKQCAQHPLWPGLEKELSGKSVSPALFHGDFAPWNIKVSRDGKWAVFDWERGDSAGMPGYDWFHYFIQTRILVEHVPIPVLARQLEQLIGSGEFQRYAALARISGFERLMIMAYLLHHNEVIRPGEGLAQGQALLAALAERQPAH
jgi:hypothetical protein